MSTVSLISHFSSGAFCQPGSTQEFHKEGVRLVSFKDFPSSSPVSAIRLSQAGFYYTGEGDKVKCFSCGVTHQGWRVGDRPQLVHSSISPNCPLVRGNDARNVSLPLPVTSVPCFPQQQVDGDGSLESGYGSHSSVGGPQSDGAERVGSHSTRSNSALTDIQTDGSEHEPTVYGTSVLSLSGPPALTGPAPNFNALQQGSASADPRSQPSTAASDAPAPRHPLPSKRLDLGGAVYPLYSQMDARRRSFQTWQPARGLPGVDELITLGFFYAGYADCVRCFFCGIGLKSWEPEDNPAEVHARWRPTCDYLRLVRGDEFVNRVSRISLNGAPAENNQMIGGRGGPDASGRPSIREPPAVPTAPRNLQRGTTQGFASNQDNSGPSGPPLPNTAAVRQARISGFRDQQIREAIDAIRNMGVEDQLDGMLLEVLANLNEGRPAAGGGSSGGPSALVGNGTSQQSGTNSALQVDGVLTDEEPDAVGEVAPAPADADARLRERRHILQQENARLRDRRTCQRCHRNAVGVIFLPCGHIVACADCAPNIRRCIRCDGVIRATANVYFS